MVNIITKTTELAKLLTSYYVTPGDIVVDGTAGNGNDTLYLCRLIGPEGKLYAFDVQESALNNTKELIAEACVECNCIYISDSHHLMDKYIEDKDKRRVAAVLFNLGYLPKGDKEIRTKPNTTISAIKKALALIRPNGVVAVTVYSGHEDGMEEKSAVLEYARSLSEKQYHVAYINLLNQPKHPPELVMITKKY